MAFLKRLKFYLIGVGIGTAMVFFMFGGRTDIKCAYFPNARTLKNIGEKELIFSELADCQYNCMGYDSVAIGNLLTVGDVDFKKSETENVECNVYHITSSFEEKPIVAYIENCDSIATIKSFALPVTSSCNCD